MVAVVVDASVAAEAFTKTGTSGDWCRETLATSFAYVPELIYLEVGNVLKRLESNQGFDMTRAYSHLLDMPWSVISHRVYGHMMWALRHEISVYDASYVALAMATGFPLVTMDRKLAAVATRHVEVHLPEG